MRTARGKGSAAQEQPRDADARVSKKDTPNASARAMARLPEQARYFAHTQASLFAPVPRAIGPQSNRIDRHLSSKLSAIFDLTQVPSPPMGRVPGVRKKAVPEGALVCHARISYFARLAHALPAGRFRLWRWKKASTEWSLWSPIPRLEVAS